MLDAPQGCWQRQRGARGTEVGKLLWRIGVAFGTGFAGLDAVVALLRDAIAHELNHVEEMRFFRRDTALCVLVRCDL